MLDVTGYLHNSDNFNLFNYLIDLCLTKSVTSLMGGGGEGVGRLLQYRIIYL